eukprot:scaffold5550_cov82-Cyclotella_meneghiniana.AAC.5
MEDHCMLLLVVECGRTMGQSRTDDSTIQDFKIQSNVDIIGSDTEWTAGIGWIQWSDGRLQSRFGLPPPGRHFCPPTRGVGPSTVDPPASRI